MRMWIMLLNNTQFSGISRSTGSVLSSITHQEAYLYYILIADVVYSEVQKKRNLYYSITYSMPLYSHDNIGSPEFIGAEREKS